MFLETLEVRGIRNLKPQTLHFDQRVTVISGQNGQGKTSLLEAVFLLSQNRSFRTPQIRDVVSRFSKTEGAFVRGVVKNSLGEREITIEIKNGRRTLLLDGKRAETAGQFFGQLRTVTFTPEELQLVKGPPQTRRSYLDRTLSMIDAEYLSDLVLYQRALKQRNAVLLSQGLDDQSLLLPWEKLLILHGTRVAEKRQRFVEMLKLPCSVFYERLARYPDSAGDGLPEKVNSSAEKIAIEYRSDFRQGREAFPEAVLEESFLRSRKSDLRLKSTSFGIHRDELLIHFSSGELSGHAKSLGSQGQVRSISLAMKLAAIEYIEQETGEPPLLLLDDVESELDSARKSGLFDFLKESPAQVFITTTDSSWTINHPALEVLERRIQEGAVTPASASGR